MHVVAIWPQTGTLCNLDTISMGKRTGLSLVQQTRASKQVKKDSPGDKFAPCVCCKAYVHWRRMQSKHSQLQLLLAEYGDMPFVSSLCNASYFSNPCFLVAKESSILANILFLVRHLLRRNVMCLWKQFSRYVCN